MTELRAVIGMDQAKQRHGVRTKAVLPVRIKGQDSSGKNFEELAHTLDVTAQGARLASIHHELNVSDEITVFFRQHKTRYRVVWIKKVHGTSEFQVGVQAVSQAKEARGLGVLCKQPPGAQPIAAQASSGSEL